MAMKIKKYGILALLAVLCIGIELCGSLFRYRNELFTSKETVSTADILAMKQDDWQLELNGQITTDGQTLVIPKAGGTVILYGNIAELHSLSIHTQSINKEQLAKCAVSVQTAADPQTLQTLTTEKYAVTKGGQNADILLGKNKDVTQLQITFASSDQAYTVTDIVINQCKVSLFSFGRFLWLFLMAMVCYFCVAKKIWNVTYDEKIDWHVSVMVGSEIFCICMAIWVFAAMLNTNVRTDIEYPLKNVASEQCFVQQFDAFMKGKFSLDVTPSQELMELDNPYDRGLRDQQSVSYLWDRAYYQGKYYSYFGAAPVLLVYFPYYFCFHKLPAPGKVMLFYTILGIIALFAIIKRLLKIFCISPNLLLLSLGSIAVVFSSGLLLLLRGWASVYYIASLAGLSSLLVFFWVSLAAYQAKGIRTSMALFALSGICLVVTVASRVNHAVVGIFCIAPFFIHYLRSKRSLEHKVNAVLYFFVPALIGAAMICFYNYARFGNPLEFGSSYQLTVSDVRQNHMAWDRFLPSVFHSFLQPAKFTTSFPQVQYLYAKWKNYGYYVYVDTNMGIWMYPLVALSLGGLVLYLVFRKKASQEKRFCHRFYVTALLTALFVAFLNFSIGGVHFRYTYDFCAMLAVVGSMVALESYAQIPEENGRLRQGLSICYSLIFLATIWIAFMLLINEYNGNFVSYSPAYWVKLRDFFCWR